MTQFLLVMGTIIAAFAYAVYRLYVKPYPAEPVNAPVSPAEPSTTLVSNPSTTPVLEAPVAPETASKRLPASNTVSISPTEHLYAVAYALLGQHLSLNESVSPEVGCAEAVSTVLFDAGYTLPKAGIPTVSGLIAWMLENNFIETKTYGKGFIITGKDATSGHIGVCGENWIMSNSSYTDLTKNLHQGMWEANYHPQNWLAVFPTTRYFIPV